LGNPPRTVQLTNAPRSGMEDDAFGRCCVACMNRCADGCRRDPAICPGAREAAPPSATSSASRNALPIWMSTWSRLNTNNPSFFYHETDTLKGSIEVGGMPDNPSAFSIEKRNCQARGSKAEAARFGINITLSRSRTRCRREAQMESRRRKGEKKSGTGTPRGRRQRQIWNRYAEHPDGGKGKLNQW